MHQAIASHVAVSSTAVRDRTSRELASFHPNMAAHGRRTLTMEPRHQEIVPIRGVSSPRWVVHYGGGTRAGGEARHVRNLSLKKIKRYLAYFTLDVDHPLACASSVKTYGFVRNRCNQHSMM